MQNGTTQKRAPRHVRILGVALLCTFAAPGAALADSGRHELKTGIDSGFVMTNTPLTSWIDGGLGKLRYDEQNDGLALYQAFIDYKGRITPTLNFQGTLVYNPELSNNLDVTEAFFEFRPIPTSRWSTRWRLGAFYPHISLENVDVAWSSPYTLSSSTINTWLAEEIRAVGLEGKLLREFGPDSRHRVSVEGAVFYMNDPTGALLTAKGWSVHNRQTGLRGELPLWFDSEFEPFQELDHSAGYYLGAEYEYNRRVKLRYHYYDNRGDQYQGPSWGDTWFTYFHATGLQLGLPGEVGFIGQWIDGHTLWQGIDNTYGAWSALLTRSFGRHRMSARYDNFTLDRPQAGLPDLSLDEGSAWTVAWLFNWSESLQLGVEYVTIESTRPNFAFAGLPNTLDESQIMFSLRYVHSNLN